MKPDDERNIQESGENPYSHDYSKAPDNQRKFVIPHAAEGPTAHELHAKETDFKMPVSFHVEGNNFYITGLENKTNTGAIIWGNIAGDFAKIKHIDLAKNLRGSGIGIALLADLEIQLRQQGVKTAYSVFAKSGTINFFLKNGYKISSIEVLPEDKRNKLDMDASGFDRRISNEDDFKALEKSGISDMKHVLLEKELS